jgi:phenylpropionate dioxygenase-like ring-hydroxylating dioxygenase large terminal subunit
MNEPTVPPETAAPLRASAGQFAAAMRLTTPEMAQIEPCTSYVGVLQYLDAAAHRREVDAIWSRLPLPLALSQDLPAGGSYRAVTVAGVSVLLTRTRTGEVKAFLNACSHRGTRLLGSDEGGCGLKLVCPYHAWTYNLEGQLMGLPRPEVFVGFDKTQYGLTPLPCREAGGLVWASLDRDARVDEHTIGADFIGDLDAIGLPGMRVFRSQSFDLQANWKLVTDAFLEGYHVTRLHSKTLARFFVDAPQMIERIGRHLRQTSGSRKGFCADHVSPLWPELRKSVVYAYIGFPSAVIVTSPTYVSVVLQYPVAVDRTQVRYAMMVDGPPGEIDALHEKSFRLMAEAFGNEDFRAAELSHEGLRTGALSRLTLGGMEQGVRKFHDVVEECLAS